MKTSRYIMVGIALIATAATLSHAQNIVRVHVDASTSLEQVLGDDWADIDSLIVTGQASSDDLKMLRRCIYDGATTGVDLSQCSVPQNVLPDAAFMAEFKPDETGALQPSQQLHFMTLPGNLEAINEYAFAYSGIRSISFPASLASVGQYAFYRCRSLRGDLNLPNSVNTVGEEAFSNSWHITSAHLPGDATVGSWAFFHIPLLRSVYIPDGCKIGFGCFLGAMSLTDVQMEDDVSLGGYAFAFCDALEQVRLPRLLPNIEDGVFYQCGLKQIEWPDVQRVRESSNSYFINSMAFYGSRFRVVDIPEGVTYVLGSSFADNPELEMVILPDGMFQIFMGAFSLCPNLKAIYSKAAIPGLMLNDPPTEISERVTLYVPVGAKATYESLRGWKKFKNIIEVDAFPYSGVDGITAPTTDDDVYYDLRGIRVKKPSCGLYIHRGKVVAVP